MKYANSFDWDSMMSTLRGAALSAVEVGGVAFLTILSGAQVPPENWFIPWIAGNLLHAYYQYKKGN